MAFEVPGVDNVVFAVDDLAIPACSAADRPVRDQRGATGIETATGVTVEVEDPSGSVIGFADYRTRPELAR